ncbi:MAG: hypothetical protein Q4B67_04175 [Eubacteriales bacterium]|nr:hypothetical protein [Eubacteriales bacterium]
MKASVRKNIAIIITALVLIFIAKLCEFLNTEDVLKTQTGMLFGMTRSMIYIALFSAWGVSVFQRIVSKRIRVLLLLEAGLFVFWMLLRTVKYYFIADEYIKRILWYGFYIPMLLVPLLSIFIAVFIGRPEGKRAPLWFIPLTGITVLLILLVLTNDFHMLVFTFPGGVVPVDADYGYGYGITYFIILFWEIICSLTSIAIMLHKCRKPNKMFLWLPYVPILAAILYGALYVLGTDWLKIYIKDLTVTECILYLSFFECCIGSGLIQSNTDYRKLFEAADFPILITDNDLDPVISNDRAGDFPIEEVISATEWPVRIDDMVRVSGSPIRGGVVFWEDDISEIQSMISELRDINHSLDERYNLIEEENRTDRQKAQLQEANRLYDRMQKETAECLKKMQELLLEIRNEKDKEKERLLLARLAMFGAYFKRRNNLLFVSETEENISLTELAYCFRESISSLELFGVSGGYQVEGERSISLKDVILLYDVFQSVIANTFDNLSSIAVIVRSGMASGEDSTLNPGAAGDTGHREPGFMMVIQLHLLNDCDFNFGDDILAEHEDELEYLITYELPGKGDTL